LFGRSNEICRRDVKCDCDPDDARQGRIPFAALDAADPVAVNTSCVAESLLREAACYPEFTYSRAEGCFGGRFAAGHVEKLAVPL
jgi:hypothetical protein